MTGIYKPFILSKVIVRFLSFRGYLNVSQATSTICLNRPETTGEFHEISSTLLWLPCLLWKSAENKLFTLAKFCKKTNNLSAFGNPWMTDICRVYALQEFFKFYVPWHCLAGITFLLRATQYQRAGCICLFSVPYKTCFSSNLTTYFSYVP